MTEKIFVLAMNDLFNPIISSFGDEFQIIFANEVETYKEKIQAILTSPWSRVETKLLDKIPNLKIISNFGVGIDAIAHEAAIKRNILITNTPDLVTEDTADLAITLMLSLARNIIYNDNFVRTSKWKISPPPLGTSISNKTIGIVGLGKIGNRVAEKAGQFGLNIVYHSRNKKNSKYTFYSNLIEMAEISDFLIVCCTGNNESRHIINLKVLNALGKKGYLINISRGLTVNENDLIYALKNKMIAGAGLDVYENEPHISESFFNLDNTILLPHIGTATIETRSNMLNLVMNNIKSYFKSGKALTPVF